MSSVGAGYSYERGIPEFFLLVVAEMPRPTVHGAVGSTFGAGMCLGEHGWSQHGHVDFAGGLGTASQRQYVQA